MADAGLRRPAALVCRNEFDVPGIARYDAGAARQSYSMVDDFLTALKENCRHTSEGKEMSCEQSVACS